MFNYYADQEMRFLPNKEIGDDFENYFQEITKGLKGMSRATNPMSVFDFQFYYSRIELKNRRYPFERFPSWAITTKKYDALIKYKSSLYFNRFDGGAIYVADLKAIKTPLEENTYKADTGYTVSNLLIPSTCFIHLPDNQSIINYLKAENHRVFTELKS